LPGRSIDRRSTHASRQMSEVDGRLAAMSFWHAILLGIVEGVTEFLPVSSTGHLTIVSRLLGYPIDDRGVTAFTAVIQVGAILAVILYFWKDIVRLVRAFFRGLTNPEERGQEWREALVVIVGSIPIGVVGFLLQDVIAGPLRSLWVVVASLVLWSAVMWYAERVGAKTRTEQDMNLKDAAVVGGMQCLALIPGVSRSGATISAGLFRGLDRVAATRIAFLLSIPALAAAGIYEAIGSRADIAASVGWGATGIATVVSFVVALGAIAWLLRLVAKHTIAVFIWWRIIVAVLVAILLLAHVIPAA